MLLIVAIIIPNFGMMYTSAVTGNTFELDFNNIFVFESWTHITYSKENADMITFAVNCTTGELDGVVGQSDEKEYVIMFYDENDSINECVKTETIVVEKAPVIDDNNNTSTDVPDADEKIASWILS